MSMIKEQQKYKFLDEDEPLQKIVSDGDILIKDLATKQKNTNITLKSELLKKKEFSRGTEFVSITSYCSGESNLKAYQNISDLVEEIEGLKSAGLTNEDIELYLDYKKSEEFLYAKYRNCEKSILKARLNIILQKIEECNKKSQDFKTVGDNSRRQQTEFALSVKPNSTETKLLKFALSNKTYEEKIPHPIDCIKQIENDLFPKAVNNTVDVAHIRKKARKLAARIVNNEKPVYTNKAFKSKWDLTAQPFMPKKVEAKTYSCKPCNLYTIKNGEIVKLGTDVVDDCRLLTSEQRLSIDDIKMLPKFSNFEIGIPSKTLYLKNLPKSINEQDLRTIFQEFDDGNLAYKIMNGKMRGQAFVYFPDKFSASRSLTELLGVFIKNKPLIVEYGKRI